MYDEEKYEEIFESFSSKNDYRNRRNNRAVNPKTDKNRSSQGRRTYPSSTRRNPQMSGGRRPPARRKKKKPPVTRYIIIAVALLLLLIFVVTVTNCTCNTCSSCAKTENTTSVVTTKATTSKKAAKTYTVVKGPVKPSFFDKSVIVGDSISLGMSNYLEEQRNKGNNPLGNIYVLCNGSLGYINAKDNPIGDSECVLPVYKGKQRSIQDSLAMIKPERVYIYLGMNDVGRVTNEKDVIPYVKYMVSSIRKKLPNVRILLESATPRIASFQKGSLNDVKIREFDKQLKKFAKKYNCGYIDLYSVVSDSKGNLKSEYCGDPDAMGLHFSAAGQQAVIKYLLNHPDGV